MINAFAAHSPVTDTMEALRFLLHGSLSETPKRRRDPSVINSNNLAWVFLAGEDFMPVGVQTYSTLQRKMSSVTYFTPNTFFCRKRKDKASLRWLNCFFADVDDPELCLLDVLERVRYAGLWEPSLVNKTPHGWHVFWKIERVRATEKAVRLYEAIQRKIVAAIGADPKAASAEHFMRVPSSCQYFTTVAYTIQDFVDWADMNIPEWRTEKRPGAVITTGAGIMEHPAIQELLRGVEEGRRDNTAFTLALAMKSAGYSQEQALTELTAWNFQNRPPLPYSQLRATVRSAYLGRYYAPSARVISELSGIEFHHRVRRSNGSGSGGGRKRGSKKEAREKFLKWLVARGGKVTTNKSQKDIAKEIFVACRTLAGAIAEMKAEGELNVQTRLLGRGRHETKYVLILPENSKKTTGNRNIPTHSDHHTRNEICTQNNVMNLSEFRKHRKRKEGRNNRGP